MLFKIMKRGGGKKITLHRYNPNLRTSDQDDVDDAYLENKKNQ